MYSERAVGQEVMKSLTPGQQVIKIVKDELTELMGGEQSQISVCNETSDCHYDGWSSRCRENDDYWETSKLYCEKSITKILYLLQQIFIVQQRLNS